IELLEIVGEGHGVLDSERRGGSARPLDRRRERARRGALGAERGQELGPSERSERHALTQGVDGQLEEPDAIEQGFDARSVLGTRRGRRELAQRVEERGEALGRRAEAPRARTIQALELEQAILELTD